MNPGALTIKYGAGGRSSVSGLTVTVFGCTGFLGRYLVNRLGQVGSAVVTPWRSYEDSKRHLKVMGDLGQITSLEFDIYNQKQLAECVRNSDVVFNLIGRDYETKNYSFANANVDSARNIAHVCREEGVPALVHMSHLSANADSPSAYLRTKAQSEAAVREEFASATIVRSATLFGHEDRFLHQIGWLANFPALPVPNEGKTIRRPVYVGDVGSALAHIAFDSTAAGKNYDLYGPKAYSYDELVDLFVELTRNPISKVYPPKWAFTQYSKFVDAISPYPKISPDVVTRLHIDEHPQQQGALTLADAGVAKPAILEYAAIEYVRRYRRHDSYHLPGRLPTEKH
ncbi:Protein-lysine N-methyltransferase efm5 [Blastocladiella emersonii ATCC 22665]|nr:Protein-lysine N-methyltransferase efm5 [Blastocladiella emersonii ATCC 22665]